MEDKIKKALLDTHVLLWALMEPERLSRKVRKWIENPDNEIFVSSASAWEISTKYRIGRLSHAESAVQALPAHLHRLGATPLSITIEHALLAGSFQVTHRDPFDRMLAAQALIEGLVLITTDPAFRNFNVPVMW